MSRLLYGVLRDPGRRGIELPVGVAHAQVALVVEGELWALVSDAPEEMLARRRDVLAHMDVLDAAMRGGPVLPFRFGTLADSDDEIRGMLRQRAAELMAQLDELDGLVQVTLNIGHDEEAALRAVVESDRTLRRDAGGRARSLGEQIALGERVAAGLTGLRETDRAYVVDRVTPLAVASVLDDRPDTVVALAMLVPRACLAELDAVVADVRQNLGHRARVDYAGPMPAYSFVR